MVTKDLQSVLASTGGSIFGYLTWYDCENAHITPKQLEQLFGKHGMTKNADGEFVDIPEDIKPKNAFQKACRKVLSEEGMTSDTRRLVVKLIVDGDAKIVYGVVDLPIDKVTDSIKPDFSDRVWLDKDKYTVHYDNGHQASKRIAALYNQFCGEYTTRDVSRMVVNTMNRLHVVSLRKSGTLYFIPVQHTKEMLALQGVINDIGQCNFQTLTLYSNDSNIATVEQSARTQINDKINAMKEDLAELMQSVKDGTIKGKTIENSWEVRMRRYKELKEKCNVIADALRIKADSLVGDLEDVGKAIKDELTAIAA